MVGWCCSQMPQGGPNFCVEALWGNTSIGTITIIVWGITSTNTEGGPTPRCFADIFWEHGQK